MAEYLVNLTNGQMDEKGIYWPLADLLTQSGVLQSGALQVSAQSTPDMTVKVAGAATGHSIAFITSSGDLYYGRNTADKNVTITSNASGVTKTDAIVAYADLAAGITTSNNPGALKFIAVRRSGSNTGQPTSGEISSAVSSNPYVVLRYVTVANGASSINSGNLSGEPPRALVEADRLESIGTSQIADSAVNTAKIASGAATMSVTNRQGTNDNSAGSPQVAGAVSSGDWLDVAGFSTSPTTTGGDLFINFNLMLGTSISTHTVARLMIDDVFYGKLYNSTSPSAITFSGSWLVQGIAAGAHTIKVQFRVGAACTFTAWPQRSFSVTEFKK